MSMTIYREVEADRDNGATQALKLPPCPICGTMGVPGEEFCVECGFLVGSKPGDLSSGGERALAHLIDSAGREFALRFGENVVGREGADVILPNRTVSRRHARITVEADSVFLEDLGSTNATRVRGAVVPAGQQTALNDRTPVQFGAVKLTVILPDEIKQNLLALPAATAPASADSPAVAKLPAIAPAGGSSAAGMKSSSAVLRGADGTEYVIAAAITKFGRKSGNNIVIEGDPFVSGSHAEIEYVNGTFQLRDTGSTNGTKLNGRPLLPHVSESLSDGDEIMLGKTGYRFRAPSRGGLSD